MKKIMAMTVLLTISMMTPAWAMNCPVKDWIEAKASSDSYAVKSGGMLLQGVHQVLETPFILVADVVDGVKNAEPSLLCPKQKMPGYVMGLVKGTGVGVYDVLENVVAAFGNIVYAFIPGVGPVLPDAEVVPVE